MNIFTRDIDPEDYIVARYWLTGRTSLREAAWQLAIGQSVGNPNVRSIWETDELFRDHSAIVMAEEKELTRVKSGEVEIAFPVANLDWEQDGISQLLCFLMGGQLDIDEITHCHALEVSFPSHIKPLRPIYGLSGARFLTDTTGRPLLGGIVKPKTGITPETLLDMVKEMVDGGVNFIKEDEILSNPAKCPIHRRLPLIAKYLDGKGVIYATCINSDSPFLLNRVKLVHEIGGNAVHVNFHSGLGAYRAIRNLNLPIFQHVQTSGSKILTHQYHRFRISFYALCQICAMSGVDSVHVGMIGGYSTTEQGELMRCIDLLRAHDIIPTLSCGMNPVNVAEVTRTIGPDYMANVGGALHGHPGGTLAGCKAMRQSIDGQHGPEYQQAYDKWKV